MTTEDVIKAAANVLIEAAMDLLYQDPHKWSDRPCPTCRPITTLLGKPFGCYRYQQTKRTPT